MGWGWCKDCGGETVSCECEEIDYEAEEPVFEEYLCEDIDDRRVVWVVGDNGVGRVEYQ